MIKLYITYWNNKSELINVNMKQLIQYVNDKYSDKFKYICDGKTGELLKDNTIAKY